MEGKAAPQGTPPVGEQPQATQQAAQEVPKMTKVKFSDQTTYELPEGIQIPEIIQKGISEKDKTIAKLKADLKTRDEVNKRFEPIERALANLGREPEPAHPDPYDDPEGYAKWVWEGADKRVTERAKAERQAYTETIGAVTTLVDLCRDEKGNVNQEKYESVLAHMRDQGWIENVGDEFHIKPALARAAYRDLYWDEAVSSARGEGQESVNNVVREAQNAAGSLPSGTGAQNTQPYRTFGEMLVRDPTEFERRKREANEKHGLPKARGQ